MIRLGLTLFIVCLASALFLSLTYVFTKPRIEAREIYEREKALKEAMPDSEGGFEEITEDDFTYYKAYKDKERKELSGYVVIAKGKGYSGPIITMVGIDTKGISKGIKILEQKETPGLGAKITKENFISQFPGKNGRKIKVSKKKGEAAKQTFPKREGEDQIMAITGATISSNAVTESIKKSIEKLFEILGLSPIEGNEE